MKNPRLIAISKENTSPDNYKLFMDVIEEAMKQINIICEQTNSEVLAEAAKEFILTECKNDVYIEQINGLFLVGTLVKVNVEGLSESEGGRRDPICFGIYDVVEHELVIFNLSDIEDYDFIQRLFNSFKNAFKKVDKSEIKYVDAREMTYSEVILHFCNKARLIELHQDDEVPSKRLH
jgi:hypothetical protein